MKKPTHVNILGVDILLATIAYATSTVPAVIHATLGEWNNYYSESSASIAKAIREFEEAESHRSGKWKASSESRDRPRRRQK